METIYLTILQLIGERAYREDIEELTINNQSTNFNSLSSISNYIHKVIILD